MIGMVLPQGMLAETIYDQNGVTITIDNGTVTINCAKAGQLSQVDLESGIGSRIADCSTIKFEGYFCESDLQKLNQNNNPNYCTQSTVDMSDAHFVNYGGDDNNHTNDYSQMKFDKWGANVTTAITSKYLSATDQTPWKLCDGCTGLKVLTLSSGSFNKDDCLGTGVKLTTLNVLADVTYLGKNMFSQQSDLTTLTFQEGGVNSLTIGNGCFNQCTGLTGTISLPKRISEIGADAFKETTGIEEVKFNEPSNLTTIHGGTFAESGIKRVTIPKSVTLIESGAFQGNANENSGKYTRLEEVTFQGGNSTPLIIQTKAFQNCVEIKDVYVEVKFSERHMICEYNAFDFKSMEGQTDENAEMTTLHFPEDDNSFNYYAGEWKKGMALKQTDLNKFKDGLDVTYNGQEYIKAPTQDPGQLTGGYAQVDNSSDGYYHPSDNTKKYAPANGWQQFARTDSKREIEIKGNIYQTYSTATPYSLPKGIIAFRVTDYEQATVVNGKTKLGKLVLKMIDQMPTETGVLLISTNKYVVNNQNDVSIFYFGDPIGTPTQYPHEESNSDKLNYLVPAVSKVKVAPVSKGPENGNIFELKGTSDFDHRNFIMRKDNHQFVRTKEGTMADNRAFLSLPKTKFTNDNEAADEGPNPWNTRAGDAFITYDETSPDPYPDNAQGAKTNLFFEYDVEEYGMIWPLAMMNNDMGITTSISSNQQEKANNGIYTLQGMKVSAPSTKGIYIVNGKKVIIK
jgi:hypothetical protein